MAIIENNDQSNVVVYNNEFNGVQLKDFNAVEIDLLMSIMSVMREKGESETTLSFSKLRELSKYNKETAISSFTDDLESTYDKLIKLNVKVGTSKKWTKFVFFTKYEMNVEDQTITISVNADFKHLINQISGNFTKLELDEITSLKSTYSKNLYRQLKQYRTTGYAIFDMEKFRYLMDIPESYKMGNIDQRVLKPAINELSPYFKNLKFNKKKGKGKDSRRIKWIEFWFKNEDGLNCGNRVFRNEDGEYYEKNIKDFDDTEIKKAYPDSTDFEKNSGFDF